MDNPFDNLDVSSNEEDDIELEQTPPPHKSPATFDTGVPVEFHKGSVSAVNQCQSDNAQKLCIFNLDHKLQNGDQYDIGGTYTKVTPDLWFYCSTSICPAANYILNLFVCHRSKGPFSVKISELKTLNKVKTNDPFTYYILMSDQMTTKTCHSTKLDQCHYLTSYCFSQEDLAILENKTLCIPIEIIMNPKCPIDVEIVKGIKNKHGLSKLLKRNENTDFVIKSSNGTEFPTHKIILATHSLVLNEIIKNATTDSASVDINDKDMELMLDFMYTGTVKALLEENLCQMLDLAYRFKLENLNILSQHAIHDKITVKNAVDLAILTEKYQLYNIQKIVFEFIRRNPQVLETDGWTNLTDVVLTKKLFKEIYVGSGKFDN